jgi:hypothetical protein
MFTLEELEKELEGRGLTTQRIEKSINGVDVPALVVNDIPEYKGTNVSPVLYYEHAMNGSIDVVNFVDQAMPYLTDADNAEEIAEIMKNGLTKEMVLDGVQVVAYRAGSDENSTYITETMCDFLIGYSVVINDQMRIRIDQKFLDYMNITLDEVREAAERNTYNEDQFVVTDMEGIIRRTGKSNGMPDEVIEDMVNQLCHHADHPMLIVTNNQNRYGFIQAFNMNSMSRYMDDNGFSYALVIPSSTNEAIMFPGRTKEDVEEMVGAGINNMIVEVNDQCVPPEEVMGSHAYIMDFTCNPVNINAM